jgi:phosphate-selective porin OprO and OprP
MRKWRVRLVFVCLVACASPAFAQTAAAPPGNQTPSQPAPPPKPPPSTYDTIWAKFTNWYADDKNPVIQRVLFTGRFHHDFAVVRSDQGDHDESNIRRVRFGPRITFLRRFLFHAEVEVNPQERNPFYMRFTDLYVQWMKSSRMALTVGKQSIPFTQEGATSSRELLTIDRSNLANNIWFGQEYMPGVSVSGTTSPWNYRVGIYSAGAANRELGRFNGGVFTLGLLGYDFAKKIGVRQALLTGNYLYQQPDADNTFTRRFEHITSIHFRLEEPKWGVRTDVSRAIGYLGQSNLWSFMALPSINATEKLQFVTRYTFVGSDDPNGVQLPTYENRVVSGRGDSYNEWYVGTNYYFYAHRLKLQSGLEYADIDNGANHDGPYTGWAWTTGIRVGW